MKNETKLGALVFIQLMIGIGLALQAVLSLFGGMYERGGIFVIASVVNVILFWAWARKHKGERK